MKLNPIQIARSLSATGLLALGLIGASTATLAAPAQYGSTNMWFEQINSGFITWPDASAAASALTFSGATGRLADPKDAALDAFLRTTFDVGNAANPNNHSAGAAVFGPWIGLHSTGSPTELANYTWSDGSAFDAAAYNGFRAGEPNGDGQGGVDYITYSGVTGWNDERNFSATSRQGPRSFIVQYDVPEPGSLLLVATAIFALGFRGRAPTAARQET